MEKMEFDKKIIKGLERMYNNFLNWFDKFSDWVISDVWLINKVYFKENKGKSEFFWNSPSYEFKFKIMDYDDDEVVLKVDIFQPIKVLFEKSISKEEANKLIEKAKKITKFYKDNKKEVTKIKTKMLLKIFGCEE